MAMTIDPDNCTTCGACEDDCPNGAVSLKKIVYVINAALCNECEGFADEPRCLMGCPADAVVPA